jgi:hypothetical protein
MFFTKPLATRLVEAAKRNSSPLQKSYRNTIYCNATLSQEGGKIVGTYCGNRWCWNCVRIRTALSINKYLPILKTWTDVHSVTLTVRNVPGDELRATIEQMLAGFTAAKRAIKRTDHCPFKALRKLECTYNIATDEYHPHFHVHVEGKRAAKLLVKRWLDEFPDTANKKAQHIARVDASDEKNLVELFKYFTKLLTKVRSNSWGKETLRSIPIPPAALDVIFRSIKGHRIYQPVGFVAPKTAADDEGELPLDAGTAALSRPSESVSWEWNQKAADWVDAETGDCLTQYEPVEKFRKLVEALEGAGVSATSTVRELDLEKTGELPADEKTMRAAIAERIKSAAHARAKYEPEFVSRTLQRIFDLTAARARTVAAEVASENDHQLTLLRELPQKVRELTRDAAFR